MGAPVEYKHRMGEVWTRRNSVPEALDRINSDLISASDHFEEVPPEAFGDEEDYWTAKRAIARAGGLVVAEHGRRRGGGLGDRPAE